MFCTNCGNEIDNDSVYCNYCGNKILEGIEEKNVEEKELERIDETLQVHDILKDINISTISVTLCIILSITGLIASIINIANFYDTEKDVSYIFGQIIFGSVFIISTILLWKLKKIGGAILISFTLFKMISSIYYYSTSYEYLIKNLVCDEIFYLTIVLLTIIGWKVLK